MIHILSFLINRGLQTQKLGGSSAIKYEPLRNNIVSIYDLLCALKAKMSLRYTKSYFSVAKFLSPPQYLIFFLIPDSKNLWAAGPWGSCSPSGWPPKTRPLSWPDCLVQPCSPAKASYNWKTQTCDKFVLKGLR